MIPIARQIFFALVILCYASLNLWAYDNFLPGSRFLALSDCGTAIPDIWSVSHNQAGLSYLTKPAVTLSTERRYMIKELSVHSLAAALPTQRGTFGAVLNYYGFSKYHELKAGLAYSLALGKKFSAGVMLDHFSTYVQGADKRLARITAELGLMGTPLNNLTVGFHLFNPFPEKTVYGKEVILPTTVRFGIAYSLKSIVLLASEIIVATAQKPAYRFGIEYLPLENLMLRMGINTASAKFSGGIGYSWKCFNVGIAFNQHNQLGTTTTIELQYSIL